MYNLNTYQKIRKRIRNNIGRDVTDFDIIIEQEKEINYYREEIKKLQENKEDIYITADGFLVKNANLEDTRDFLEQFKDNLTITIEVTNLDRKTGIKLGTKND